jgi:hypothetical protein
VDLPPLFVDIQSSALKLYSFVVIHVLSVMSILLISDIGLTGSILKVLLILLVALSFKQCLSHLKNKHSLYLKADNQADLSIGNRDYYDLQLSGQSYVSDMFMLLVFLDRETGDSHSVTIFPDSIDTAMHSRLRARLKLFSDHADTVLA